MDYLKNALIALVVAAVVAGGLFTLKKDAPIGAVSGPDILSPYFSFGGVRHWAGTMSMRAATNTPCSIQSPAATTTLVAATANIATHPAYAARWNIGSARTAYATTTKLASKLIVSGGKATIVATSTALNVTLVDGIVAPNTYINVKIGTSSFSGTPTGTCTAVFREI